MSEPISKQTMLDFVSNMFVERMPFNKELGLNVTAFDFERVEICFDWQDKFIGNPQKQILHGGVIASVLDVAGGLMSIAGMVNRSEAVDLKAFAHDMRRAGTIDMRTDYLRPGLGKQFTATACVIRSGTRVCVCRMELHNEEGTHIAFGTGTYLVDMS